MPRPTNQNTNKIKMMPKHIWKSVTIISRLFFIIIIKILYSAQFYKIKCNQRRLTKKYTIKYKCIAI